MAELYASLDDIRKLWRPMNQAEIERAGELLPVVCSAKTWTP